MEVPTCKAEVAVEIDLFRSGSNPQHQQCTFTQVWIDAASQIFYSLGPAFGVSFSTKRTFRRDVL